MGTHGGFQWEPPEGSWWGPETSFPPVFGALEPVEDVGAAGVVHLVEGVRVRLLDGDGVTVETDDATEMLTPPQQRRLHRYSRTFTAG